MASIVDTRFRITIEKSVRERLGLRAGDRAFARVDGQRLIVEFTPARNITSQRGIFRRPDGEQQSTGDWPSIRDRVWAARTLELVAGDPASATRTGAPEES